MTIGIKRLHNKFSNSFKWKR